MTSALSTLRPLSICSAPPGVLGDAQPEGTVQTWGLSTEGEESTADVTMPWVASASRLRREYLTLALGAATAAVVAALVVVAILGVRDAAIPEPGLQPRVLAIVPAAEGPGVMGGGPTSRSKAAASSPAVAEAQPSDQVAQPSDQAAESSSDGIDDPSPPEKAPRTKPSRRRRPARANQPGPAPKTFIPTDI